MIEWLIMADIQGNAEKLMKMEHDWNGQIRKETQFQKCSSQPV